jgi:hypothetical protein
MKISLCGYICQLSGKMVEEKKALEKELEEARKLIRQKECDFEGMMPR